jgi:hypothetical protein
LITTPERMRLAGHVAIMVERRNAYWVLVANLKERDQYYNAYQRNRMGGRVLNSSGSCQAQMVLMKLQAASNWLLNRNTGRCYQWSWSNKHAKRISTKLWVTFNKERIIRKWNMDVSRREGFVKSMYSTSVYKRRDTGWVEIYPQSLTRESLVLNCAQQQHYLYVTALACTHFNRRPLCYRIK